MPSSILSPDLCAGSVYLMDSRNVQNMLRHIRLLILDLDYLVFDCARLKIESLRRSLIALADAIPQNVRLPDHLDAEEGFIANGYSWASSLEIGLDEESLIALEQAYRINEDKLVEQGIGGIYPGMQECLARLRESGLSLALGAEARRDYLLAVSDRHEMERFFDFSLCTEEFGVGTAGEMFEEIMHFSEVTRSETVVLGIHSEHFSAARDLGLFTIGCGWGIHRKEAIAEADIQVPVIPDLFEAVRRADDLASRYLY